MSSSGVLLNNLATAYWTSGTIYKREHFHLCLRHHQPDLCKIPQMDKATRNEQVDMLVWNRSLIHRDPKVSF